MMKHIKYGVMWGGVCHLVPYEDIRKLVRAGMAEPSRREANRFDGLTFATAEYRTPAEAVSSLAGVAGQGVSAATSGAGKFWDPPRR